MNDEKVEQAAAAVAEEIVRQIDAALAEDRDEARRSGEVLAAARGLEAEAATLGDPEEVRERVERLRAQLAQLSDAGAIGAQRRVLARAAVALRERARSVG